MPVLDRHRENSVDRNLFLQTLLGALALSTSIETIVVESGPARIDPRPTARADDGGFIDATLGLLVLTRRVQELARSVAEVPTLEKTEPWEPRRGLLA